MMIDDLMDMTVKEVLDTFCAISNPECGHFYGIATWEDVAKMFEEFDLEDEYCFYADSLISCEYEFDYGECVLKINDLRKILDYLGIEKKE